MEFVYTTAYAKINLSLELTAKRQDGYHELSSIFHKIAYGDIVGVLLDHTIDGVRLCCSDNDLCPPQSNLAYRAAVAYQDVCRKKGLSVPGITVSLTKKTPVGAGLGGGSADAAAVIDLLQDTLGVLSDDDCHTIACMLGADVPFCLKVHTCCLAQGIGTELTELPPLPSWEMVVAKPKDSLATPAIYRAYDALLLGNKEPVHTHALVNAIRQGGDLPLSEHGVNDFEQVCLPMCPPIGELLDAMKQNGAFFARMSGSGSAIYGFFKDALAADSAFGVLQNTHPEAEIFRTHLHNDA